MSIPDRAKAGIYAQYPQLPLLRLQKRLRLGALPFGSLITLLITLLGLSPLAFLELSEAVIWEVIGVSLFFGTSLGIICGFLDPVLQGAERDLEAMRELLSIDATHLDALKRSLSRASPRQVWSWTVAGLLTGAAHSLILGHHESPMPFPVTQTVGTVLIWLTMFTTMPKLMQNASLFARLGTRARPDLLRPSRHAAFGSAALRPALFLIGLLCAYGLLGIYDENPLDDGVWIGLFASALVLVSIVVLPLRGIRERIRDERRTALADLDARFETMSDAGGIAGADAERLAAMDTLLDMRERIARAPGWPMDLAVVRRILLYIVLPPLTWAAAALVEMMIDDLL